MPSISGAFLRDMFPILIWPRFPSSGTQDLAESASSTASSFIQRILLSTYKGSEYLQFSAAVCQKYNWLQVKTFKAGLDRYLTLVPDEPLIPGYTRYRGSSSNSLLNRPQDLFYNIVFFFFPLSSGHPWSTGILFGTKNILILMLKIVALQCTAQMYVAQTYFAPKNGSHLKTSSL